MLGRRPGVGAATSGAPSPAEGIGARPPSIAAGAGAGAGRGAAAGGAGGAGAAGCGGTAWGRAAGATGAGPRFSTVAVLRLPNTQPNSSVGHADRFSISMMGANRPDLDFLVSPRPVSKCASWRNVSAVRWEDDSSAIIWPLLAAVPNICGSNGITATGWSSSALAKSAGLISGRLGTPTRLRQ